LLAQEGEEDHRVPIASPFSFLAAFSRGGAFRKKREVHAPAGHQNKTKTKRALPIERKGEKFQRFKVLYVLLRVGGRQARYLLLLRIAFPA